MLDPNIIPGGFRRHPQRDSAISADNSPDRIVELLVRGNQKFVELRERKMEYNSMSLSGAAQGETPFIAVLNYARLSTSVENIFGHKFSDIFTIDSSQPLPTPREISGLEYAVLMLGVKVILILDEDSEGSNEGSQGQSATFKLQLKDREFLISDCDSGAATVNTDRSKRLAKLMQVPLLNRFSQAGNLKIVCGVYDRDRETVRMLE